jgi:perosamine synthetase
MKKNNKKKFNDLKKKLLLFFKKKSKRLHDPLFFGNEKKYLIKCIDSGYVSYVGNYVNKFEKKISYYTKSKYSVATCSGTAALHLALCYYKVNHKDEILLPSFTYVATASVIKYCNASLNFVDIEKENLGVCPKKLLNYINKIAIKNGKYYYNKFTKKKLKALIVVHVYGFASQIEEINKICRKFNIILIEDSAEAIGTFCKNKHLGTFADIGILSFNGNKTIAAGGAGAILTKRKKIAKKLKHLSTHAKLSIKNDHVHDQIGFNYRMTNLTAAVACAQLENIKKIISAKRRIHKFYYNLFKSYNYIKILSASANLRSNYWLVTALFNNKNNRDRFIKFFSRIGMSTRVTWRPLHTLKIFKGYPRDNLQNTRVLSNKLINLPSSPILGIKN